MRGVSTRAAAKKLGLSHVALGRYVALGKVPAPGTVEMGSSRIYVWTDEDIECVRKLLPGIANGRKTRYQKKQSAKPKSKTKKKQKPQAEAASTTPREKKKK